MYYNSEYEYTIITYDDIMGYYKYVYVEGKERGKIEKYIIHEGRKKKRKTNSAKQSENGVRA